MTIVSPIRTTMIILAISTIITTKARNIVVMIMIVMIMIVKIQMIMSVMT